MGWLGLSLLSTLIILGLIHWNNRTPVKDWKNTDAYVVGGIVGGVFSLAIIAFVGGLIGSVNGTLYKGDDTSHCETYVNSWDIVTAVRDKSTSSSFILGTGGSHTVDRYYVYREEPQGLMFTEYNAKKTYVIERDGTPQYERIDYVCPKPIYDFLWWSSGNTEHNIGRHGTLYVPKDTILREFRM